MPNLSANSIAKYMRKCVSLSSPYVESAFACRHFPGFVVKPLHLNGCQSCQHPCQI
ncbi:hypothetical protein HMPREF3213_02255 [Heyndrickxia coagulans]|uniref:Uncharacterized protein n=1 Tax=Heyndrickxia coagulans TaxID=1398 RepID=A0A133KLT3_HEYCO|nr:hypothetical protein HMPREF3213_02255 [Heyndrickxia coagulans]